MPKKTSELSALAVKQISKPGMHTVGGVPGLYLQALPTGGKTWILRFSFGGKKRDMGLGGFPEVSLTIARERAREARDKARNGIDPIKEAKAVKAHAKSAVEAITFEQCAFNYIELHKSGWRNEKHAAQWPSTLKKYVFPKIGGLPVQDVTINHMIQILEPIWIIKTESASRIRGRIERILNWAKGRGYRSGENPAAWRGNLEAQLPDPNKVATVKHYPALPINEMAKFMVQLRNSGGVGAKALEFTILTAARSGETRGATWDEIDFDKALWVIPANRMKANRDHRVPLSSAALKLLSELPKYEGVQYLFPSPRGGKLSDMALTSYMRRHDRTEVVHGFRSTFRDWAAECTMYPFEMAEMALAHKIGNAVEAAYRRGDLLERRRLMMEDWATFIATPTSAVVLPFQLNQLVA